MLDVIHSEHLVIQIVVNSVYVFGPLDHLVDDNILLRLIHDDGNDDAEDQQYSSSSSSSNKNKQMY